MSERASAHAAQCRACGDELRERTSLRALVGGLGKVEAPADFEFRLRARMAAAKVDRGYGRFSGARWLYGFAPVAVAACFVVVSATLYFRQAPQPANADASAVASTSSGNAEPVRALSGESRSDLVEPVDKVKEIVKVSSERVASGMTVKPLRRGNVRSTQSREVAFKGRGGTESTPKNDFFSTNGAPVIHLKASAQSLRVILRDERGTERVVPMRSVSFGSQSVLAREAATRPSAAVEVGGVW